MAKTDLPTLKDLLLILPGIYGVHPLISNPDTDVKTTEVTAELLTEKRTVKGKGKDQVEDVELGISVVVVGLIPGQRYRATLFVEFKDGALIVSPKDSGTDPEGSDAGQAVPHAQRLALTLQAKVCGGKAPGPVTCFRNDDGYPAHRAPIAEVAAAPAPALATTPTGSAPSDAAA